MTEEQLVVVGVDGSDCSLKALRFAVDEAKRRGAALRIVTSWMVPAMAYADGMAAGVAPDAFREGAETASAAALEEARRGGGGDLSITSVVPEKAPVPALLEAAEGADLLVVGSRGRGGFASLLLGSVSAQLAQHAPCPITIVRSPKAA